MANPTKLLVIEYTGQSNTLSKQLEKAPVKVTVALPEESAEVGITTSGHSIAYMDEAFEQLIVTGLGKWVPNYTINKLQPGKTVIALSDLDQWQPQSDEKQHLLFLNGIYFESHPAVSGRVMNAALKLQTSYGEAGLETLIFTHNLKVAGDGLEALYQKCKKAGVHFVKFSQTRPEIEQDKEGQVTVRFVDEASGQDFFLQPDLTVVDETFGATNSVVPLAEAFRLEKDAQGFLQADNVHRLPVGTNHRAVWVTDALRGTLTPEEAANDLANAALAPLLATAESVDPANAAGINPNHCVRCLTCFRACPHGAVVMAPHPVINAAWCRSCGICVAECPKHTIQMIAVDEIQSAMAPSNEPKPAKLKRIIVFGCSRSAIPSAQLAHLEGHSLDLSIKMIQVPCAGAISSEHLLKAMTQDVEGVLIVSCHLDNCNAGSGNCLARNRVEALKPILDQVGFDAQRVAIVTLANNMGAGFAEAVNRFAGDLADL